MSDTPGLDAQVLLAHVLAKPRAWIIAHPEYTLTSEQMVKLKGSLSRLQDGEPLPYVLGHWEFFGLDFAVNAHTLIPRPETELLVENALAWLHTHISRRRAADIGTGSGCIAVALAAHITDLHLLASDISLPALRIARYNARNHSVEDRVHCVQSNLLPPTRQRFDLICANLPYIPTQTLQGLNVHGKEPNLALNGGENGLHVISSLILEAPNQILPAGLLLLEIEASQGPTVAHLARQVFPEAEITILPDLSGHDRLIKVQTP